MLAMLWKDIIQIFRYMQDSYTKYPRLDSKAEQSLYYRKHNKRIPQSFFFCTGSIFLLEITRTLMIIMLEPFQWSDFRYLALVWVFLDVVMILGCIYCASLKHEATQESNKLNLAIQTAVRLRLRLCGLVTTGGFATCAILMVRSNMARDLFGVIYIVLYMFQFTLCVWLADGVLFKAFLMIIFNLSVCLSGQVYGQFAKFSIGRVMMPVLLALMFFVKQDHDDKVTFLLKRRLKEQKNMYQTFLQRIRDPVVILGKGGIAFYNQAFAQDIAQSYDEFHRRAQYLISPSGSSLAECIQRSLEETQERESAVIQEKFYRHREDTDLIICHETYVVTLITASLFSSYRTVSLLLHDVTNELAQAEKQFEEKYKNMLFFSLSHELRTPLNILQPFLSLSKELRLTSEQLEYAMSAKGAWRYLRNKINDILDYSQLMTGEFLLHSVIFSLRRFVHYLQRTTLYLLDHKRSLIRLDFNVDDSMQDAIEVDRCRLEQVLFNLLSNAVKYTSEGTISLAVYEECSNPRAIAFQVQDTGCGMPETVVKSLFVIKQTQILERELQDKTFKKKATGLCGLGLTVSRMLCDKMGAKLTASSIMGRGSSFVLTLPSSPAPSNTEMDYEAIPEEGVKAQSSYISLHNRSLTGLSLRKSGSLQHHVNVLVVDDNQVNRLVAVHMIQKYSFNVMQADNGQAALQKLQELQLAQPCGTMVVLMDIDMPVMDGIEATVEIRRRNNAPRPYIAALTAFASEAERIKCMEAGMDNFLTKPLTKENLHDFFTNLSLLT